jgi:hypothetical protein
MKTALLILLFLLMAAISTAQMPVAECDGFRRKVGILTDGDTPFLSDYDYTTITGLTQLPLFAPSDTTPRQEVERHLYMFEARILAFRRQPNGDIYLVLRDPYSLSDSTIAAIIPNPECTDVAQSTQSYRYKAAYEEVVWMYGDPDTTLRPVQQLYYPLTITGVPFYNMPQQDMVQAANRLEIHPILCIGVLRDTAVDEGGSVPLKMNLSRRED